jgi:hypothetical protein
VNQRYAFASVLADKSYLGKTIAVALALLASVALFLCAGTKEAQAQLVDADVTVDPERVDFGDVEVGKEKVVDVTVKNNELTPVVIDTDGLLGDEEGIIDILGPDGKSLIDELVDGLLLGPGESKVLQFVFNPAEEGPLPENSILELNLLDEALGTPLFQPIQVILTGTGVAPAVDGEKPTVSIVRPKATTTDRTPKVRAIVEDNTPLTKENIDLFIDNNQIADADYTYDPATGKLVYNSTKLSGGKHIVKVVATDAANNTKGQEKAFKVVKKKHKQR